MGPAQRFVCTLKGKKREKERMVIDRLSVLSEKWKRSPKELGFIKKRGGWWVVGGDDDNLLIWIQLNPWRNLVLDLCPKFVLWLIPYLCLQPVTPRYCRAGLKLINIQLWQGDWTHLYDMILRKNWKSFQVLLIGRTHGGTGWNFPGAWG